MIPQQSRQGLLNYIIIPVSLKQHRSIGNINRTAVSQRWWNDWNVHFFLRQIEVRSYKVPILFQCVKPVDLIKPTDST